MKKLVLVERQFISCRDMDQGSCPTIVELECDADGNVIDCKENDDIIKKTYPQDYEKNNEKTNIGQF